MTDVATSGALLELCLPARWNGVLVVWGHGYTNPGPNRPPYTPLALPADEASGFLVKDIIRTIGTVEQGFYGYASTSYRRNGLVAPEAVEDLKDTSSWVRSRLQSLAAASGFGLLPIYTYLVGASEGGLSTVLTVEQPQVTSFFDGALALCAPAGDFQRQLEWFGDYRIVFDYFFPGVMPGTAVGIPNEETVVTDANWEATSAQVLAALDASPDATRQLVAVTELPHDAGDPETIREATTQILRYSFMGTNDATSVLGGNPIGNRTTSYEGSDDDGALNAGVARHDADPTALASVTATLQTSGSTHAPLVAMHTARDPVTPVWHTGLYQTKNQAAGGETVDVVLADRFGHCDFSLPELLAGFSQLIERVTNASLVTSATVFHTQAMKREFLELTRRFGSRPVVIEPLPD